MSNKLIPGLELVPPPNETGTTTDGAASTANLRDSISPSPNESKIVVTKKDARFTEGSHGFTRGWGVSGKLSGAKGISMAYGALPPHIVASPHLHEFDTAIYILGGRVRAFFGDDLREFVDVEAGDFLFIPANLMHGPVNMWDEPMTYLVARATAIED